MKQSCSGSSCSNKDKEQSIKMGATVRSDRVSERARAREHVNESAKCKNLKHNFRVGECGVEG